MDDGLCTLLLDFTSVLKKHLLPPCSSQRSVWCCYFSFLKWVQGA